MRPVFDIHTHLGASPSLGFRIGVEELLDLLDQHEIEQAVTMPFDDAPSQNATANDVIAEAVARHSDRLVGFARVHPKDGERAVDEFRRCVETLGLRGLKLHPLTTGTRVNQADSIRLVQMAADYGLPVYYHSGDDPSTQPTMFEFVARQVPEATIILGHAGGFHFWRDAADLAARFANVYLSTPGPATAAQLQQTVQIAGAGKILFGSDAPAMHPAVEMAKIDSMQLSEEETRLILYENSRRLLGLNWSR